ncbi:MAG: Gfo/Idh/MocA family oxidoreductase [Hyphomonadaceae bacterium]|nr:Gfo/Idh/MocA family oxidoreductase [Clostridia bacterium]
MCEKKVLKVGIIGCGGIANNKHLPGLKSCENILLVAFCDIVIDRAQKAKEEYGTEDAKVYTDYRELLEDKSIDVVHVLTPNISHAEISIAAMEADKHVMCEKPMAKTSKEARAMVEAQKKTGKLLTIGYQNRFRADSTYLKSVCEHNELGDVYFAKAHAIRRCAVPTWGVFLDEEAQGGGPLIDIGTHSLDLTLWFLNKYDVKYVVGNTYHKLGKKPSPHNTFGEWNAEDFNVEDSAFGFITMKDGTTIVLESSWALHTLQTGEAIVTLCGTEGGADMQEGLRLNGAKYGKFYTTTPSLGEGGVDFYDGKSVKPNELEAQLWMENVRNNTQPLVTPAQALVVTEILEAIYTSAKTGKPVFFE